MTLKARNYGSGSKNYDPEAIIMVPEIIIDEKSGQKRKKTKGMAGGHEKRNRADRNHPKRSPSEGKLPGRTDGQVLVQSKCLWKIIIQVWLRLVEKIYI